MTFVQRSARGVVEDLRYVRHLHRTIRALRRELAAERQANEVTRARLAAVEAKLRRTVP